MLMDEEREPAENKGEGGGAKLEARRSPLMSQEEISLSLSAPLGGGFLSE